MKFKVGDWVTCETGGTNPYKIINENILKYCTNGSRKNVKLWQPEEGEWCWFYFSESVSDHNCLTLGKFIGFRNKESNALFLEYYDTDNNIFASDMCEPFIGNLPSFIKEIK